MPKCPSCKTTELHLAYYEDSLPVSACSACAGSWLRANEYAHWLRTQTPGTFKLSYSTGPATRRPVAETSHAMICPDCGHFLRRYQVSSTFEFHLDRCSNCNGVWLDQNEWQALREANLHHEINQIFTQPWQKHIQDEIKAKHFEEMYRERFGDQDYAKIKEIRQWLQENPNRNGLIGYLLDKNPYTT